MTATIDPTATEAEATEVGEATEAPVAQADSRYADEATAQELAQRVLAARQAGFSRTTLRELTDLSPAQLWRVEQGRAHRHEVTQVREALAKIDSGEAQPPRRPGKTSEHQARLDRVQRLLEAAQRAKTKAEILDGVSQAIEALTAQGEPESPPAPESPESPATEDAA